MQKVFTISELNHTLQGLIASNLGVVKVDGEISNFVKPASGHFYFTLKDSNSQIRCVMFKSKNKLLSSVPKNGDKIIVRASPSLYEPRGELQLVVDNIETDGIGNLLLKLEKLKQKIRLKGWTDLDHKKSLPKYPKNLAVITSPSGAAIFDVLNVLKRRAPSVNVRIIPAIVQGYESKDSICNAINSMNKQLDIDLCLLVRGGGSLEDLWSFNEETVLKAIFESETPIVCGVGHETDYTLSELVSDVFAPTPSAAAEIATQHYPNVNYQLRQRSNQLVKLINHSFQLKKSSCFLLLSRLNSSKPANKIHSNQQKCDALFEKSTLLIKKIRENKVITLRNNIRLLSYYTPHSTINSYKLIIKNIKLKQFKRIQNYIQKKHEKLTRLNEKLSTLDPKATLKRGYSITLNDKNSVISHSSQINDKDTLKTILYDGFLTSKVKTINE